MKTITDDPVGFIDNGGWTFLDPDSEGEDAHNDDSEDEEDDAYEPTDSNADGIYI
jgi:nucleosome binding factor SPN SPT16 subunit